MKSLAAFSVLFVALASTITATPPETKKASSSPQYGKWGFDTDGADLKTKPGDDFFRYANGAWLNRVQIPADKPAHSLRLAMSDKVEQRLHDLMEDIAKTANHKPAITEGKVGAFYKSFMDEKRIEKNGASPLKENAAEIQSAKTREALAAMMGRHNADLEGTIFGAFIDVDLKDPNKYAVYLSQSGLGLPDRDYYLKSEFAAQKGKYQAYIAKLLHLIDWPNAEKRAADVVSFETRIAEVSWTKTQQRDPIATYNPMSVAELETFAPDFAWRPFLSEAKLGKIDNVIVAEKSAFPKIASVIAETPIETLQAWQAFNIADHAAPYLSKGFADAYFEMRNKTLSGQAEQQARWKRGVHAVSGGDYGTGERYDRFGNLGWAVGQLYAAKYFPPEAKAKIEELVANLKVAMHARIEALDWMGPATKTEALKKLDTYNIKVGYPDRPRDYSKVEIRDDDIVGNVRRAASADWEFYVNRLGGPVDRTDLGHDAADKRRLQWFIAGHCFSRRHSATADVRSERGPGDKLRRDRWRDRPRTDARFRRSRPQDRCGRKIARLVDGGRRENFRSARSNSWGAVFEVRAIAWRESKWRTDDGRKHCRPRWTHDRARCLSRFAQRPGSACHRWTNGRTACLSRVGPGMARQAARRRYSQASCERSAFAASVSRQRRRAKH